MKNRQHVHSHHDWLKIVLNEWLKKISAIEILKKEKKLLQGLEFPATSKTKTLLYLQNMLLKLLLSQCQNIQA